MSYLQIALLLVILVLFLMVFGAPGHLVLGLLLGAAALFTVVTGTFAPRR